MAAKICPFSIVVLMECLQALKLELQRNGELLRDMRRFETEIWFELGCFWSRLGSFVANWIAGCHGAVGILVFLVRGKIHELSRH
ncbi:hypothetical protein HDN1F_02080 [gamma proteobacterium HdN1]|nr:hypothetical protein HDN1F_02080 [gamma proteobacterium HdN1]